MLFLLQLKMFIFNTGPLKLLADQQHPELWDNIEFLGERARVREDIVVGVNGKKVFFNSLQRKWWSFVMAFAL